MKPRNLLAATAFCLTAIAVLPARAQPTNAPARNPDRRMPPAGAFLDGLGPAANILTDEQRASFAQVFRSQRERRLELSTKILAARQELFTTALAEKFDESAVRTQAVAVATLEAEMAVLRLKALSQVQPPLSPEQIEKMRSAMPAGPARGGLPPERPAAHRSLSTGERDENDLPAKQ